MFRVNTTLCVNYFKKNVIFKHFDFQVHASGFNSNQPLVYKLFKGGDIEKFLYTDQFIYTSENGGNKLSVYSSNLCQFKNDGVMYF